jgi:hypothetical protein
MYIYIHIVVVMTVDILLLFKQNNILYNLKQTLKIYINIGF